jgi:multidrug efflux pump
MKYLRIIVLASIAVVAPVFFFVVVHVIQSRPAHEKFVPSTIIVDASYPGANARVVADTVAAPIEQQINGVEGMLSMRSYCSNDGKYSLVVSFAPGTDLAIA